MIIRKIILIWEISSDAFFYFLLFDPLFWLELLTALTTEDEGFEFL